MIFDAHSDVLYDVINNHHTWDFHLQEMKELHGAIINYYFKGDESNEHFKNVLEKIAFFYENDFYSYENQRFLLGIEGLGPLENLSDVEYLKRAHIKSVTLTWNDENLLATGAYVNPNKGLKEFGKQVLDELFKHDIMVDLSHANEKTFFATLEHFKGKVFASHSNARTLRANERNLSDEQIMAIKKRSGVIGVNAYAKFVGGDKSINDVINHIDYLISIVGEDAVCLGLDLDYYLPSMKESGAIKELQYPSDLSVLINKLKLNGYSQLVIEKICYKNILRFIDSSLIL